MADKPNELETLRAENERLSRLLATATAWMQRQWREDAHKIAKRKAGQMTEDVRADFLRENQEEIINTRIRGYFGDILLMNAPSETVEFLVDAEIAFFNLSKSKTGDGLSVISSYTKILDTFIESFVTNQFRKYAVKRGAVILRVNDPLEKALHFVITKKYTLSIGRLYGLLKSIRAGEKLPDYGTAFRDYLAKYRTVGDFLLSDAFFQPFSQVVESDVFGGKRHNGKISLEETVSTRQILLGNFTDKASLLYQFLESQGAAY
jgi:Holliday junction resolvase-like predicted endonuclease